MIRQETNPTTKETVVIVTANTGQVIAQASFETLASLKAKFGITVKQS